ncbi:MAG TPA: hypothetical protein VMT85_06055 [Thermoanaerobaculia bacterium]|nr:hypothetical protein [Thermoanaerobaculia bacterium]
MPSKIRLGRLAALACGFALFVSVSAPARAEWDLGLRAGLYSDVEEAFVGVEGLTNIGDTDFVLNPNAEIVFVDNGDLFVVSLDVHYDLDLDLDRVDVWLGLGPTVLIRDPDRGRSDDDFGLNLLAGIGFREGAVRPYAQFKVILADDTEAVIAFGVRFF